MPALVILRKKIYRNLFCVLFIVQILNLSIDAVDPHARVEDLSINDIESCVELVVEIMLGHHNAFEETDDHDHSTFKPGHLLFYSFTTVSIKLENTSQSIERINRRLKTLHADSLHQSVISPPPKMA